jgi:hypothetical protein
VLRLRTDNSFKPKPLRGSLDSGVSRRWLSQAQCPFRIGDRFRFAPSERTRGVYQGMEGFGISPGEVQAITEIRDGCYLYFANGSGGWPWNEFAAVDLAARLHCGPAALEMAFSPTG